MLLVSFIPRYGIDDVDQERGKCSCMCLSCFCGRETLRVLDLDWLTSRLVIIANLSRIWMRFGNVVRSDVINNNASAANKHNL